MENKNVSRETLSEKWKNEKLINKDAINKMSATDLEKVLAILEKIN
jgi:hypothetical protein